MRSISHDISDPHKNSRLVELLGQIKALNQIWHLAFREKMEEGYEFRNQEDRMDLPPGFRFHPTDEELICHYLQRKAADAGFVARAIGDIDLNKSEPWELPWKAKLGEKEWYFFCVRDRKYPTGLRTNRATEAGYWKATGKDKEIYSRKSLVGMKKTLVFYRGRAPKGEKTNWVMHEYRLEGKLSHRNLNISKPSKARFYYTTTLDPTNVHRVFNSSGSSSQNEWVICRVFHKTYVANKTASIQNGAVYALPQLTDPSSSKFKRSAAPESAYVPCFSSNSPLFFSSNTLGILSCNPQFSYPNPGLLHENPLLTTLLESSNGTNPNETVQNFGTDSPQSFDAGTREDQEAAPWTTAAAQVDMGFIWD